MSVSFFERRKSEQREVSAAKRAAGLMFPETRIPEEDIEARFAEIPSDTRSLTARLFGDPMYERSALYHKRSAQGRNLRPAQGWLTDNKVGGGELPSTQCGKGRCPNDQP